MIYDGIIIECCWYYVKMTSIEDLQHVIETCESRLSQQDLLDDDTNSDYCVFPANGRVLYHQLLGDSYLKLYVHAVSALAKGESRKEVDSLYGKRCIIVLESGMKAAADYLQIVDRKNIPKLINTLHNINTNSTLNSCAFIAVIYILQILVCDQKETFQGEVGRRKDGGISVIAHK